MEAVEGVKETATATAELAALLDAGAGAVAVLEAGDTRLVAHAAVLAARSPVFAAVLRPDALQASGGVVAVSGVEGAVLRLLLAYCYTLRAPQLPSVAAQLLLAAEKCGLPLLKAECERQVAAQLSVETAAATALLAVRHSCASLRQAAVSFVRANLVEVMATRGWADAVRSQPEDVVKLSRLLAESPAGCGVAATEDSGPHSGGWPTHDAAAGDGGPHSEGRPTPAAAAGDSGPHSEGRPTPAEAAGDSGPHSEGRPTPAAAAGDSGPHSEGRPTPVAAAGDSGPHSEGRPTPAAAAGDSGPHSEGRPTPATTDGESRPHSEGRPTPAGTAPPPDPYHTSPPDDAIICRLQSLSAQEKNRRLILAAKTGEVEALRTLLAAGADIGAKDWFRRTTLHFGAMRGHVEVVRCLLENGAVVDTKTSKQNTPLHWAAYNGHVEVVRLLIAACADPNARNWDGRTPLHCAAAWGHAEAAAALLQAGADKRAEDHSRLTPLDLAMWNNEEQVVRVLR
ncbi:poly [ADP-ribose] polymerase tankyrase-1-like isoform X4 [Schistocerca gregaria]|uniref:poly [ADP-ribose] polymerase tankyrase-1-like isoform X2 n=1 Tax=Schistocerca gregaria TaxID=7010 RepID=UPI00211F1181|nr:poly [ADP-ribose] polymerase tankyrase-1-like isoform X2 [Schistocerca gregaria]XP_049838761.1 poly [ADP-ribose] polymerase tankyrase-1-like isoform X2 [Schistocerca gregaria]XP_049838763.1 poly [ADP-ribose] polymerase tankyrase-1-like isoform X4 [Schistocerca gregaria]